MPHLHSALCADWSTEMEPPIAPLRRAYSDSILALPDGVRALTAVAYLLLYVTLDWLSFVEPFGAFAITPWNPATGLSVALILLLGRSYLPYLFLAPLLAEAVVRGLPAPLPIEFALAGVLGGVYGTGASLLAVRLPANALQRLTIQKLSIGGAAAIAMTAVASTAYVGVLVGANLISIDDFATAAARLWVGDLIGIAVVVPLLVVLLRGSGLPRLGLETLFEVVAIIVALSLIRSATTSAELHTFYLLFLPVVWIAVRHGIGGAVLALALAQVGLMIAIVALAAPEVDVTTYQAMMLVLAMTGLVIGGVVSDRQYAEGLLQQQREAQSRLARLGSIGELSAALAHEINQPLTAATTYVTLAVDELDADDPRQAAALEPLRKCAEQVKRAATVVRRLRDYIKHGNPSRMMPMRVGDLVDEALGLLGSESARAKITVERNSAGESTLPLVLADSEQITQVLINILANAYDALDAASERVVTIGARDDADGFVEIRIEDTGMGFPAEIVSNPFVPLRSGKPYGLGLGLALCRSIIRAHGGDIHLDNGPRGAIVRFSLAKADGATT